MSNNTLVGIDAISLPVQFIPLVHEYLNGISVDDLAIKYNMEPTKVSEFLNRREVRSFISTKLKNYKYLNLVSRIDLLSQAVEEKVEFAKENEMPLTNRDILDVLKLLREESKDLANEIKEDNSESNKNTYINILNQLS